MDEFKHKQVFVDVPGLGATSIVDTGDVKKIAANDKW